MCWTTANTIPILLDITTRDLDLTIEEVRQEMAILWLVTWIARPITDCTVLRAVLACSDISIHRLSVNVSAMEQNVYLAATNLARSVFSLSQLARVTYTTVLSVILDVLATFFAERRLIQQVGWCQACRLATERRLRRLQKDRPYTLCRIQHVARRLIAAVSVPVKSAVLA